LHNTMARMTEARRASLRWLCREEGGRGGRRFLKKN